MLRPDDRPVSGRRRVFALIALVLIPVGIVLVVVGLIGGLPQLLYAVLALIVAGLAAWRAFGHLGVRRTIYAVIAVLALVAWLVLTLSSGKGVLFVILGVVLMFIGASAASTSLLHAPRQSPEPGEPTPVRRVHHPALFVNPKSGGGTAERVDLAAHARERGIDVHMLEKDTDLFDLARRAVRSGADCLGAAGGDGTLAIVAEVAIEAGLPFVCIPAGTRNHFALDLGLDREDPLGALDAFGEAVERRIDVGDVSGKMFLNNVSIGAYGEIVGEEEYRDNKVGTALLKLPDLIGPDAEPLDLRFVDGSGKQYDTAVVVHVSNNSYVLTPRPGFGSRPSLSDGELGIVVVVPGARGAAVKVLHWEAPSFTVESAIAIASGLDGESIPLDPPAEFSIRRGALRVRTPLGAPGVSPGAKLPPLSVRTFQRLTSLAAGHIPAN